MKRNDTDISDDIFNAGTQAGLGVTDSGGGFHYITKNLAGSGLPEDGPVMVLGVPSDAGSPEGLEDPATVTLYFSDDWQRGIRFEFDMAKQAIDFMVGGEARGLDKVVWQ